jgi:RecA-family ATPase
MSASPQRNGADLPQRWGADPATWVHFFDKLAVHDLWPVVANPNAPISPNSKLAEEQKGKAPSNYNPQRQIRGIPKWQHLRPKRNQIDKWMREPDYGICIVTREARGIDSDITDPVVSADVRALIVKHFGALPIRSRSNSQKFLAALTMPGKFNKKVLLIGDGRVEFLANGQQFIAAGTHRSGVPYEWESGLPAAFPVVAPEALNAFWNELQSRYGADAAVSHEITDEPSGDPPLPSGSSPERLDGLLARIDPAKLNYDDWLYTLMAVHFETQGSSHGFYQCEAWSMRDPAGYREAHWPSKWESFNLEHPHPHNIQLLIKLAGGEDYSAEFEVLPPQPDADAPAPATPRKSVLRATPLTLAMLKATPPEPEIIVESLLLMDACGFVAPGGTGKTTVAIHEAVHIILGRPLWGRRIVRPGPVVFATAEDSERIVRTRLIQICQALRLSDAELEIVADGFYIEDLSMVGVRLVGVDPKTGLVRPTPLVADIIARYRDLDVSLVHLDPASLLGPGEQSGNDGMSELMRAARQIAAALGAACQIVHHVAQVVARSGIQDQYAGRGGTAFADNSRGQRQLVRIKERGYEFDGKRYRIPDVVTDGQLAEGDVLAILVHKLSYVKRDPRPIFIVREGFSFRQFECEAAAAKVERSMEDDIEMVAGFVQRELLNGKRHSRSTLEAKATEYGLTQIKARAIIKIAIEQGVLIHVDSPKKGGLQKYLTVAEEVPDDLHTPQPS